MAKDISETFMSRKNVSPLTADHILYLIAQGYELGLVAGMIRNTDDGPNLIMRGSTDDVRAQLMTAHYAILSTEKGPIIVEDGKIYNLTPRIVQHLNQKIKNLYKAPARGYVPLREFEDDASFPHTNVYGLPAWDGEDRLFDLLSSSFQQDVRAYGNTGLTDDQIRNVQNMAMIAAGYQHLNMNLADGDEGYNLMPTLVDSAGNIGKTSFLIKWYEAGFGETPNEIKFKSLSDQVTFGREMHASSALLVNEVNPADMRGSKTDDVKSFIDQKKYTYNPKYGTETTEIRRTLIMGTSNHLPQEFADTNPDRRKQPIALNAYGYKDGAPIYPVDDENYRNFLRQWWAELYQLLRYLKANDPEAHRKMLNWDTAETLQANNGDDDILAQWMAKNMSKLHKTAALKKKLDTSNQVTDANGNVSDGSFKVSFFTLTELLLLQATIPGVHNKQNDEDFNEARAVLASIGVMPQDAPEGGYNAFIKLRLPNGSSFTDIQKEMKYSAQRLVKRYGTEFSLDGRKREKKGVLPNAVDSGRNQAGIEIHFPVDMDKFSMGNAVSPVITQNKIDIINNWLTNDKIDKRSDAMRVLSDTKAWLTVQTVDAEDETTPKVPEKHGDTRKKPFGKYKVEKDPDHLDIDPIPYDSFDVVKAEVVADQTKTKFAAVAPKHFDGYLVVLDADSIPLSEIPEYVVAEPGTGGPDSSHAYFLLSERNRQLFDANGVKFPTDGTFDTTWKNVPVTIELTSRGEGYISTPDPESWMSQLTEDRGLPFLVELLTNILNVDIEKFDGIFNAAPVDPTDYSQLAVDADTATEQFIGLIDARIDTLVADWGYGAHARHDNARDIAGRLLYEAAKAGLGRGINPTTLQYMQQKFVDLYPNKSKNTTDAIAYSYGRKRAELDRIEESFNKVAEKAADEQRKVEQAAAKKLNEQSWTLNNTAFNWSTYVPNDDKSFVAWVNNYGAAFIAHLLGNTNSSGGMIAKKYFTEAQRAGFMTDMIKRHNDNILKASSERYFTNADEDTNKKRIRSFKQMIERLYDSDGAKIQPTDALREQWTAESQSLKAPVDQTNAPKKGFDSNKPAQQGPTPNPYADDAPQSEAPADWDSPF